MGEEPERKDAFKRIAIFDGNAKIGEIIGGLSQIQLKPEDFSSPVSLQMAFSRIYEALMKTFEEGFKKRYVAEVRFTDSLGNPVAIAVDLGESPPPLPKKEAKARVIVEIYYEDT